jgi:hypothetical protein
MTTMNSVTAKYSERNQLIMFDFIAFLIGQKLSHGNHTAVFVGQALPDGNNVHIAAILLIVIFNVGISWMNAGVCGRSWEESKACGGILRLVVWCTVIASAIGFSSVVILPLMYIAHENAPSYFTDLHFQNALQLWYLSIIFPTIGAGLSIVVESWVAFYRDGSLLRLGAAAWNTFAQVHNTAKEVENMGGAFNDVFDRFFSAFNLTNDKDDDNKGAGVAAALMILLIVLSFALIGGFLITAVIVRYYAGTLPLPERDISYMLNRSNRIY